MGKKFVLPPITAEEQKRIAEIEFYRCIKHFYNVLGFKIDSNDILELLCKIAKVNVTLVKTVATSAMTNGGNIQPSLSEVVVMWYRKKYNITTIAKNLKISRMTVYRILSEYDVDIHFTPRIKEDFHDQLNTFTALLKGLMSYDEHRI